MLISVLVVSFESREYLGRCLGSVERLLAEGHEVLVVDNGSSDGSSDFVRKRYPAVRVLAQEKNLGFGTANNLAAAEASGDAFLLLNPDAWLDHDCARRLVEAMESTPRLGLASPAIRYPSGSLQFNWNPTRGVVGESVQTIRNSFRDQRLIHRPCARLLRALGDAGWFSACCCLIRRDAWIEVAGFDEDFFLYFEDVDLGIRLHKAGWRMAEVPGATAFHEEGATQPNQLEYRRSQFLYYKKHRRFWENLFLIWKQRRKFSQEGDPQYRGQLLSVLREAEAALRSRR